jgi:hypothetical protein
MALLSLLLLAFLIWGLMLIFRGLRGGPTGSNLPEDSNAANNAVTNLLLLQQMEQMRQAQQTAVPVDPFAQNAAPMPPTNTAPPPDLSAPGTPSFDPGSGNSGGGFSGGSGSDGGAFGGGGGSAF